MLEYIIGHFHVSSTTLVTPAVYCTCAHHHQQLIILPFANCRTELKKVKKEKSKEKDRGKERERSKDKAKAPKKGRGIEKEDKGVTPNRQVKSPPSPAPKSLVKEPPKGKETGRHLAREQEKDRDWDKREQEAKPKPPDPMERPPPSSHNGKLKKSDLKSESSNESE